MLTCDPKWTETSLKSIFPSACQFHYGQANPEISNLFEKLFYLNGDFTATTF